MGARSPLVGALLSFLLPGLGQLYGGAPRRALAFMAPALLAWAAVLYGAAQGRFALLGYLFDAGLLNVLLLANLLLFVIHAWAIVDAWRLIGRAAPRRGAVPASAGGGAATGLLLLLAATVVLHGVPEWYGYQVAARLPAFIGASSPAIPTPSWLTPTASAAASLTPGQSDAPSASPTAATSASPTASPSGPLPASGWAADGRLNVLLIGSDAGPGRWSARPDAIHLLSVDVASGRAALFAWSRYTSNFPVPAETASMFRDGRYPGYINELYVAAINNPRRFPYNDEAGWGVVAGAVQELSGVPIDGYAMVDLIGFSQLIDELGGLWVDVPAPGVVDSHYGDGYGRRTSMRVNAGCQQLNGKKALFFSRSRHQDGDIPRLHRQQVTLASLRRDYDPLDVLARLPDLLDSAAEHAHISFAPSDWAALAELATRVDPGRINKVVFEYPEPYPRNLKDDTVARIQAKVRGIFDEPQPPSDGGECPSG
ncbi:MAG TPA: LCP family protein [Candidatus Limnocylindrales bacterium]|jgi:LCP family protein required for cell wall assembly